MNYFLTHIAMRLNYSLELCNQLYTFTLLVTIQLLIVDKRQVVEMSLLDILHKGTTRNLLQIISYCHPYYASSFSNLIMYPLPVR